VIEPLKSALTDLPPARPCSYDYSNNQGNCYTSPYLHHVLVKGLAPGQTYTYSVSVTADPGSAAAAGYPGSAAGPGYPPGNTVMTEGLQLTVPPAQFPLKIGVLGDPGQTPNTTAVLSSLAAAQPQLAWIVGDFSYADKVYLNAKPADALKADKTCGCPLPLPPPPPPCPRPSATPPLPRAYCRSPSHLAPATSPPPTSPTPRLPHPDCAPPTPNACRPADQPLWDTWQRLFSKSLLSAVPFQ
jgi:hypothetical protein